MQTQIYDRRSGQTYIEKQFKERQLAFLYGTIPGRILLRFISGKMYSRYHAWKNDLPKSTDKIIPFINEYHIDMEDFEPVRYQSYNEFFTRQILPERRPLAEDENKLIAVADSKLLYYPIEADLSIKIKDSMYTVEELLKDRELAGEFKNGICLVFRLTVDDYHHYCCFDDARVVSRRYIHGRLHTVGPISAGTHKVYSENCREYTVLQTKTWGLAVQMEIGALLVGRIKNRRQDLFVRGEEKGYFEMGGSTIVILLKEGVVKMDEDIQRYSEKGIETKVRMRERIGEKVC